MQHKYYSYSSYFHTHSTHSSQKDDDEGENVKGAPEIKDFKENHTDTSVSFTIEASKDSIDKWEREKDGLIGKFKLKSSVTVNNMNMFDKTGTMKNYANPEAILKTFFHTRLHYYELRKEVSEP